MALEEILNLNRKPKKIHKVDVLNTPLAKRLQLKLIQKSQKNNERSTSVGDVDNGLNEQKTKTNHPMEPLPNLRVNDNKSDVLPERCEQSTSKASGSAVVDKDNVDTVETGSGTGAEETFSELELAGGILSCQTAVSDITEHSDQSAKAEFCEDTITCSNDLLKNPETLFKPDNTLHKSEKTDDSDVTSSLSLTSSTSESGESVLLLHDPLENVPLKTERRREKNQKTSSRSSRRRSTNFASLPLLESVSEVANDPMVEMPSVIKTGALETNVECDQHENVTLPAIETNILPQAEPLPSLKTGCEALTQEALLNSGASPKEVDTVDHVTDTNVFSSVSAEGCVNLDTDNNELYIGLKNVAKPTESFKSSDHKPDKPETELQNVETKSESKVVLMEDIPVDKQIQEFLEGSDKTEPPPPVKRSRGRRKSADLLSVMEASALVISPDSIKADLPMKYTRRARKQRRMSLELFRASQEAEKRIAERAAAEKKKKIISENASNNVVDQVSVQEESEKSSSDIYQQLVQSDNAEVLDKTPKTKLTKIKPRKVIDNSHVPRAITTPSTSVSETSDKTKEQNTSSISISRNSDHVSTSTEATDIAKIVSNEIATTDNISPPSKEEETVTPTNSFISEDSCSTPNSSVENDSPRLIEESPSSAGESPRRSGRKRRVAQPTQVATKGQKMQARKRKAAEVVENVEDVYRNKLWRDQMPKEKAWETIFEEPKRKKTGEINLLGLQRKKCFIKFDEYYNLTNNKRIQQRRKKALQMGWRPKKNRQSVGPNGEDESDILLQERISQLDAEIIATSECEQAS